MAWLFVVMIVTNTVLTLCCLTCPPRQAVHGVAVRGDDDCQEHCAVSPVPQASCTWRVVMIVTNTVLTLCCLTCPPSGGDDCHEHRAVFPAPPGKLYMTWLFVMMIVTNTVLTLCCLTFLPGKLYIAWLFVVVMIVPNTVLSYLSPQW